jgi:LPXTG-site transpeptidase (sortase) family protein
MVEQIDNISPVQLPVQPPVDIIGSAPTTTGRGISMLVGYEVGLPTPVATIEPRIRSVESEATSPARLARLARIALSGYEAGLPPAVAPVLQEQPKPKSPNFFTRNMDNREGSSLKRLAFYGSALLLGLGILPPKVENLFSSNNTEAAITGESIASVSATTEITLARPVIATTEVTTTTEVAPETTVAIEAEAPYSYMEAIYNGDISLEQTSGQQYATLEIPKLCLDDVQAFGSNKVSPTNPVMLDLLRQNGKLTPELEQSLATGKSRAKADVSQLFDPIYVVKTAEVPQQACDYQIGNSEYPARWERTPKGSSLATYIGGSGVKLGDIQPIVDIDYRGVAPGQPGNVVISGHRTTESAAFANIDALTEGDDIIITGDNGSTFTYRVIGNEIVAPNVAGLDSILSYTNGMLDSTLTMYSCDDGGKSRYVVRAVLVQA